MKRKLSNKYHFQKRLAVLLWMTSNLPCSSLSSLGSALRTEPLNIEPFSCFSIRYFVQSRAWVYCFSIVKQGKIPPSKQLKMTALKREFPLLDRCCHMLSVNSLMRKGERCRLIHQESIVFVDMWTWLSIGMIQNPQRKPLILLDGWGLEMSVSWMNRVICQ